MRLKNLKGSKQKDMLHRKGNLDQERTESLLSKRISGFPVERKKVSPEMS